MGPRDTERGENIVLPSRLLENAFATFSTLPSAEQSSARLAKQRLASLFWRRIHTTTQPGEFFNWLLPLRSQVAVGQIVSPSKSVHENDGGGRCFRAVHKFIANPSTNHLTRPAVTHYLFATANALGHHA